ncbi:MAG: hypothetical protein EBZ36_06375 [Acidobacteria bacterium]|nr:hypothetical protein [Acidobacteriota bacterium]
MIDLTTSNYTITTTEPYCLAEAGQLMTPALLIYPEIVDANIRAMIAVLGGDTDRWRPHIKTSKLEFVMRRLVDHGIINFKCATTLELITACNAGARDILIAYPVVGANARRVAEIIDQHPSIHFSVLVENDAQVDLWRGRSIGIFIDINPGMNRTGITTAPDLLDVVDVEDGKSKRLLCGKVLVSTLLENFPDDGYVGKTFQVTMGPVPQGKRYKTCEVRLVELDESGEEPQDDFRNGGTRGASGRTEPTKPKGKK